jgi:hypothetical protein
MMADPRFDPGFEKDGVFILPDRWKIDYQCASGELSKFYKELKENARLMGTRCPSCGITYFWPRSWCHRCYEDCEWVEMSGKGVVPMFTRVEISLNDLQTEVPYIQGGVLLDGAAYPAISFIRGEFSEMENGMRVRAEFLPAEERTGRIRDFFFVPDK